MRNNFSDVHSFASVGGEERWGRIEGAYEEESTCMHVCFLFLDNDFVLLILIVSTPWHEYEFHRFSFAFTSRQKMLDHKDT